ncbi:RDD family protein [Streptomyces pathocidini]|uniref:RDD family protein n=1 Tax=Streptomyces pathocidini TaxID=1650571 RepID=UPI0033EF53A8
MSHPDPNNPYAQPPQGPPPQGQPPQGQPYGYPQPPAGAPGYGYPQQPPQGQPPYPQQPPAPGHAYPQQPPAPGQAYPQQPGVPPQQGYPSYPGGAGYPPPGGPVPGMPPFAGWWSRAAALLLDSLITSLVPLIIAGIGYAQIIGDVIESASNCAPEDQACLDAAAQSVGEGAGGAFVLITIGALLGLGLTLWLVYQEGRTGQTPGKKALGIAVLREVDGSPLGFGNAFARRICHIVDGMACYIGYLWPIWDAKKQTFADKIIKSVVVKVK